MVTGFLVCLCLCLVTPAFAADKPSEPAATGVKPRAETVPLQVHLRSRVETEPGSARFHVATRQEQWDPRQTAIIVCDMWNLHHCLNATRRGAEMAPRMNRVLQTARDRGVTIIHAPSGCMAAYENHPARLRAKTTPKADNLPQDIGRWCYRIPAEDEDRYPIDQSDGGEDDGPAEHAAWAKKLEAMGLNPRGPWTKETELLDIYSTDYISDNGEEIWSILEHDGIKNVVLLGVHANMCVLGRPFGLRQMAKNGKHVVLMRDMTDTMYNPKRRPYVSHFTGTDLIVQYIEKYVCPTITSVDFLGSQCGQLAPRVADSLAERADYTGGEPFRFRNDKRPRLVIVMAEREYHTNETLPPFALAQLGKRFSIDYVFADTHDRNNLPGIQILDDADIALISVRRRALPKRQMDAVRRFLTSGKPVVGIRTASHAFAVWSQAVPDGYQELPEFDQLVLGGNYHGHHGEGPKVEIEVADGAEDHAILAGVDVSQLKGNGSLYQTSPLGESTTPLLIGSIPDQPAEPVAWTNVGRWGNRVFYTSLGHPEDFDSPQFTRLLRNAVYWAAGVDVSDTVKYGQ